MRKGIIFDLDGTLADTLSSIAYFANRALMQNGFRKFRWKNIAISSETVRSGSSMGAQISWRRYGRKLCKSSAFI